MSALLWFWIGTVVGSFVGFGCFCLLQASGNDIVDAVFEELPDGERVRR